MARSKRDGRFMKNPESQRKFEALGNRKIRRIAREKIRKLGADIDVLPEFRSEGIDPWSTPRDCSRKYIGTYYYPPEFVVRYRRK